MFKKIRTVVCLTILVSLLWQQTSFAYSPSTARTCAPIIGVLSGLVTAGCMFYVLQKNDFNPTDKSEELNGNAADNILSTLDPATIEALEIEKGQRMARHLVISIVCGAAVGMIMSIGSRYILLKYSTPYAEYRERAGGPWTKINLPTDVRTWHEALLYILMNDHDRGNMSDIHFDIKSGEYTFSFPTFEGGAGFGGARFFFGDAHPGGMPPRNEWHEQQNRAEHFRTLGLDPAAPHTNNEISRVARHLLAQNHPDKFDPSEQPARLAAFQRIVNARDALLS